MDNLVIAEIAGRDSVAAAIAAVNLRGFRQVLPTIALTGTEMGDFEAPGRAVELLTDQLAGRAEVLEPLELSEPELWSALNARFAVATQRVFGIYSPCLACHLYLHLLRVPVSWAYHSAPIVAGERDTHDGRMKLSQTSLGIDAAIDILAHAGVELIEPVRTMSGGQISDLVGGTWDEGSGQLGCLLSGNYKNIDGSVSFDESAYARYITEFFEPIGRAVVDAWRTDRNTGLSTQAIDYEPIVRQALQG